MLDLERSRINAGDHLLHLRGQHFNGLRVVDDRALQFLDLLRNNVLCATGLPRKRGNGRSDNLRCVRKECFQCGKPCGHTVSQAKRVSPAILSNASHGMAWCVVVSSDYSTRW